MKNGFSESRAFELDDATRQGWCIIFGELEGGKFNWNSMAWDEPK